MDIKITDQKEVYIDGKRCPPELEETILLGNAAREEGDILKTLLDTLKQFRTQPTHYVNIYSGPAPGLWAHSKDVDPKSDYHVEVSEAELRELDQLAEAKDRYHALCYKLQSERQKEPIC